MMSGYPEESADYKSKNAWSPPLAPTAEDWAWWRQCASECGDGPEKLSPKEREFVLALARWRGQPSEAQVAWLIDILQGLFGRASAEVRA